MLTIDDIKEKVLKNPEYEFLATNKHLGNNIVVLGLGGSYAYGTNVEGSDIDIRGVALNKTDDLLLGRDFEQIIDEKTDTTVYSLKKIFRLLTQCNPNVIEILGLNDDQLIYSTRIWKLIRNNRNLFLSKKCINTFGGYANAQLRRLETASARAIGQEQREKYIFGSIQNAEYDFLSRYARLEDDSLKLYIDKSEKEDFDTEIMVDVNLKHYPLRDLSSIFAEYNSIVRGYDKIGARNSKAIEHSKLGKHMMHLVRLYFMVFDVLEKGEINTYRKDEHDLLMEIRNGKYLIDGVKPTEEFFRFVDSLEKRLERDKLSTTLPDEPDYEAINELYLSIVRNQSC